MPNLSLANRCKRLKAGPRSYPKLVSGLFWNPDQDDEGRHRPDGLKRLSKPPVKPGSHLNRPRTALVPPPPLLARMPFLTSDAGGVSKKGFEWLLFAMTDSFELYKVN